MSIANQDLDVLEQRLHLGAGFHSGDRPKVLEELAALSRHLVHWRPEKIDIALSVKHRETFQQRVMLEVRLPRWPILIAHYSDTNLDHALVEVRKLMIREIEEERERS
ncbi:MAG TPA: hypothetical protein VG368_08080 [Acidimicrobiales bacterium]|jgi:hypothetical protein|nr:hypothetical protein [Acidimicrobiales bacterium]